MIVVHNVRLYRVLDTVVISGDDVSCSVVFGTLVGVVVLSVMWSELLMTSAISFLCGHESTECGMFVMYCMQCYMSVSALL